jgi:MFS family permease
MLKDELRISATQLGILLSAFFWTYACLQPLAGWLVDRVNVNWVIAGGFFLWSAATAATGLVRTFSMLFALRLLLGIGESVPVEKPRGRNIFATLAVSVPQNGFFAGPATYGHPRRTALIIFPLPHGSLPPNNFQLFRHGLLTA